MTQIARAWLALLASLAANLSGRTEILGFLGRSCLLLKRNNPLGHTQPGFELIGIERLGDKVIRSGFHALQVILFSNQRGNDDDVGVFGLLVGADPAA